MSERGMPGGVTTTAPSGSRPRKNGDGGSGTPAPNGEGRPDRAQPRWWERRRPWLPSVMALLVALFGVLNLASALSPPVRNRLRDLTGVVPGTLAHAATAATIVAGLLLLLLAKALRRRKRRAWRATVALLAATAVLHVVKGLDIEEAAASTVLLVVLVVERREFRAKGDPRTRWRAVGAGLTLLLASVVIGLLLIVAFRHRLVGHPSLSAQVEYILLGLIGVTGPVAFVSDRANDVVDFTLAGLGMLTLLSTAYLALRPPEPRPRLTMDDEHRMRELLGRFGDRDSLGYFALRRDKSVIWSPSGKSAIAYRVVSGVMLASGDPLGDNEAWPGAIARFLEVAEEHAWTPAVIGCSERGGTAWSRAGLSALEIGDEAIVDASTFSLEGRSMRNVRQAVGRVERAGYTVRAQRGRDITLEERRHLRAQAGAWRGAETERGFSMALGRFGDPADGDCVAVTAFDADGVLRAFLHFVPWGKDGLSLDLMRRDKNADNGLNEYLIVSALRHAQELGVRRMSLNFAAFRSAFERGERLGAGPIIRFWRRLLVFASRWFQIESLYRFNAKFQPEWAPRYACFPGVRDVPRIALAMLEAEAYIVWPTRSMRRWRHRVRREQPRVA